MSSNSFYYQNASGERKKSQFHYDAAEDPDNQTPKGFFSATYSKLAAACIGLICIVALISSAYPSNSSKTMIKTSNEPIVKPKTVAGGRSLSNADISIVSPGYGALSSTQQLSWKFIAEPGRTQVFLLNSIAVEGEKIPADEDLLEVEWTINGQTFHGVRAEVTFSPTSFGTKVPFSMTVSAKRGKTLSENVDSLYSYTMEDEVAIKYVRREFRTLTESDKHRFISAMSKVYSVSEEDGKKLYGSKFHNIEYYLAKHLYGAGRTDCDHWHDGAGLVPHHTAFTLELEQSLQAVDGSVSMPYWEYGMDKYLYSDFSESAMFATDFMGALNGNADHRINDDSFWSEVKVPSAEKYRNNWSMKETKSLNPYVNAYGAMRSPWNNNPTPYIGRHNTTYDSSAFSEAPSCSSLQACFQSSSISDMNYCLNGGTHGPVHILIGGAWGDEDTVSSSYNYLMSPSRILFFKILWRKGYTRCPETCDISKSSDDTCRCAVPQEYLDKYGAEYILTDCNVLSVISKHLKNPTDDDYLDILHILEHPGQGGEMFTSAAPFDPTFWPLHGSMERMMGLRRLLKDEGVADWDETWGYPEYDSSDNAAYLPGVCDWSGVSSQTDLTLPVCDTEADCFGHGEDDVLEFSNFLNQGETYTNSEFYTFLHPNNVELPYVYDSYTFDYCTTYGYDFLDGLSTKTAGNKKNKNNDKQLREGAKKDDISSAM